MGFYRTRRWARRCRRTTGWCVSVAFRGIGSRACSTWRPVVSNIPCSRPGVADTLPFPSPAPVCEPSQPSDSALPCARTGRRPLCAPCSRGSRRQPSAKRRLCCARAVSWQWHRWVGTGPARKGRRAAAPSSRRLDSPLCADAAPPDPRCRRSLASLPCVRPYPCTTAG